MWVERTDFSNIFFTKNKFFFRYLNVMHRESEETNEAFTERMRSVIASALSVKTSSFTATDKVNHYYLLNNNL